MPEPFKIDPASFKPDAPTRIDSATFKPDAPTGPLGGKDASISKAVPGWVEGVEDYGIVPGAMALGALGGGAFGGATTFGAGAPVGAAAGAGIGAVAGDALKAEINKHFFNHTTQFTPGNVAGSFVMGAATEAIPGAGEAAITGLAKRGMRKAATKAAEGAEESFLKDTLPAARDTYAEGTQTAAEKAQKTIADAANKARQDVIQKMAPEATQTELGQLTGVTPEKAAAINDAGRQEFAMQRGLQRSAVFEPERRIGQELGSQFDAIYAPHADKPVEDLSHIQNAIADEREYLKTYPSTNLSPKVREIFDKLGAKEDDSDAGIIAKVFGTKELNRIVKAGDPGLMSGTARTARQLIKQATEHAQPLPSFEEQGPVKIGELLGYRQALDQAVATSDGTARTAAANVRDAINSTLLNSGVMVPRELKEEYGLYKSLFDKNFRRTIATETYPKDYAAHIYENPQRFHWLYEKATPQERQSLKGLFGEYAQKVVEKDPQELAKNVSPRTLRTMFGSDYKRLEPWLETPKKSMDWQTFMNALPENLQQRAYKEAQDSMAQGLEEARAERASAFAKTARKAVAQLGPAGRGILATLDAQKTPEAMAEKAAQILGPIFDDVPKLPVAPADRAGWDAYQKSKAIQNGLDMKMNREAAAVKRMRELAAAGDPYLRNLKQKLQFYVPVALALGASGHVSPYLAGAGGFALAGQLLFRPREMFLRSLNSDAAASDFWNSVKMSPNKLNAPTFWRRMGRAGAKMMAYELASQGIKAGTSADVPPEDKGEAQ